MGGERCPFTRFWSKSVLQKVFVLLVFLVPSLATAEPTKITMKVGERKQHSFKNVGDDPKLLNKIDDIFVGRDFDDPKVVTIQISPTTGGTFYFGVASTKEGKTLVEDILIEVEGGTPGPGPKPNEPPKYGDRLLAPYMVSPAAEDLASLIKHLTELNKAKYTTKEDALLALRKHTITGIKGVRDEIGKIIGEQSFSGDGFQSTITDVIASLKYVQGKK